MNILGIPGSEVREVEAFLILDSVCLVSHADGQSAFCGADQALHSGSALPGGGGHLTPVHGQYCPFSCGFFSYLRFAVNDHLILISLV